MALQFETLKALQTLENFISCDDGMALPVPSSITVVMAATVPDNSIVVMAPEELESVDFDMNQKKRSKKPKKPKATTELQDVDDSYEYTDLLKGFYLLRPFKVQERKKLPSIHLVRIGSKRTRVVNFQELCGAINRTEQHVNNFFSIELGTMTSLGAPNNHLTIRGILSNKQVEDLLLSYMKQYVRCEQCKVWDTEFRKENDLTFVCCNECEARRILPIMKRGFQAKTTFSH